MEFENLIQDREFCEKLENAENDDVIIQLFAEKGILPKQGKWSAMGTSWMRKCSIRFPAALAQALR